MVDVLGIGVGATIVLLVVVLHFSRGTEWTPTEDISSDVLERRASTVPETDFPEPMNRSIGGGGVAAGAVGAGSEGELEDGEGEETVDDDPSAIPDDEAETYEIEFVKEGTTISVKENTTVLEAGEEEGWDLPYACRQGQCISCAGHITDGGHAEDYIEHHTNEMLGDAEMSEGYTLTCVAYPTTDFSIETGESP
ncbi:2Fe-2S iron-sulfur cluster-binding protein [Halomarina oriensis]|uniref:2Fe-2S iron-sulfur cluster binding domain-containing protein n=1 Tax=Halomarina oriensis TaxID=671145 RepID=A0A6B0GPE3_9EURY|nr:2Fe-2S iron-sulfur cluster-binding protein [Halomarina oriensis]MWG36692.1 2Fe-2S iron-sulfur cluster binding domain-containing protein [Halomarina oriensis]